MFFSLQVFWARLKNELEKVEQRYEYVFIDCPPALSWLTVNAFTAADGIIVVVSPGYFELDSLMQINRTLQKIQRFFNPDLKLKGYLFTMSDSTRNAGVSLQILRQTYTDRCQQRDGKSVDLTRNHRTQIHVPTIDMRAREKIVEALQHPELVRARVEELRAEIAPVIETGDIEATIENIRRAMQNLFNLAQNATDDETLAHLTQRLNELEKQKREAEGMLYDLDDEEEERKAIEKELVKFETWAAKVRPYLTDPTYKPSYEELRLAVRILGIRATVFPTVGNWPYRYQIEVTVPEVLAKVNIMSRSSYRW